MLKNHDYRLTYHPAPQTEKMMDAVIPSAAHSEGLMLKMSLPIINSGPGFKMEADKRYATRIIKNMAVKAYIRFRIISVFK
jgi:hypothetical protein